MEQRVVPGWTLTAPRKDTYYRIDGIHRSDYPPICQPQGRSAWNMWHLLSRPPRRTPELPESGNDGGRRRDKALIIADRIAPQTLPTISTIESLPNEIVGLILDHPSILTRQDIINFGLSSPTLWPRILSHLQMDCIRASGSLIGVEMALLCDKRNDLPASFKKDNYSLIDKILRRRSSRWGPRTWAAGGGINSSYMSFTDYTKGETTPDLWMGILKESMETSFHPRIRLILANELRWTCNIAPFGAVMPDSRIWTLRNLSTMEYVRCFRCENGGRVMGNQISTELAIEDVLLWYIQCSSGLTGYYGQEYSISTAKAGSWAGHCFDIILLDEMDNDTRYRKNENGMDWKDVTNDVCLDMKDVPTVINRYRARVMEYREPWYALKQDMESFSRNMNS
ncbi:hypothetical protein BGW36DRAFT_379717 [Talaromyces proteolyticus]|uniref:Uncharacterized protein n=1 Tax=Talaromyces proteolyticus TaxID=1131652 RepID=A0AAD4KSU2_9EURO|nr:uncharacterized protein BGW36DRAFT_379717 [Talaromyces proteolyticus]KAH8697948.1 hypothetical protein BGW36DRAFT_379717 [Talaromyces proteolyticus]